MKQSTFSAVMANGIKNLLQRYTKGIRFVAVLTMLLTMGIGQVWGADTWTLVTDASTLKAGDELVIVSSKGFVAGSISNSYMTSVSVTISNNTISNLPSNAVTLTLGGSTGSWTFTNSSGKKLGATAEKKVAWGSGTTTWSISISSNNATINNTKKSYGRFLYNVNSPRFTTYTSSTSSTMVLPQLYKKQASETKVTLTKGTVTNGSISLNKTSVTTTSAAQSVTVTCTPNTGYYTKSVSATKPATGNTPTYGGSGNSRTVTYSKGSNGSSTITATFSPQWQLRGTFNNWGTTHPLTSFSGNIATVTVDLQAMTAYTFKFVNVSGSTEQWYGNTGAIITDISDWAFSTSVGDDARLFTGPAGTYTFKFNISTKALQVIYPTVTHPAEGYAYFQKQDSWNGFKVYNYTADDDRLSDWDGSPSVTNTTTICGKTYYYTALATQFQKVIFRDNGSNQWKEISVSGYSGKYCGDDYNATPQTWKTFNKYSITFNSNGGSGTMSTISGICPGDNQTLPANTFTRTGYTFDGWATSENGNKVYNDNATISNINSDITLYAKWKANYTVTFDLQGHGTAIAQQTVVAGNKATRPADPSATGYTFGGWYKESACTNVFDFNTVINANTTIYAKWTAKKYTYTLYPNTPAGATVIFKDNAENSVDKIQITQTYGEAVQSFANFYSEISCEGYRFEGWYSATSGGFEWTQTQSKPADNGVFNFYARWTKVHTITWKVNKQTYTTGSPTTSVDDGATYKNLTLPTPPANNTLKECYDNKMFVGWSTTNIGSSESDKPTILFKTAAEAPNTAITDNITLYAVFATESPTTSTSTATTDISGANSGTIANVLSWSSSKNDGTAITAWSDNHFRLYPNKSNGNGSSITITPKSGITINEVVLTATSIGYAKPVKYNIDGGSDVSGTWNGTTMTISDINATSSFKFRNAHTGANNDQVRVTVSVTYLKEINSTETSNYVTECCTLNNITLDGSGTTTGGTFTATATKACKGETVTLTATAAECYEFVSWTIKNTSGTDVTNSVLNGNTLTMPDYAVTVYATFKSLSVTEIALSMTGGHKNLDVGDTNQLLVTYTPADATCDKAIVSWTSSDDNVISVTNSGLVTALRSGNATITATTAAGVSDTYTIVVNNPACEAWYLHYWNASTGGDECFYKVKPDDPNDHEWRTGNFSLPSNSDEDGFVVNNAKGEDPYKTDQIFRTGIGFADIQRGGQNCGSNPYPGQDAYGQLSIYDDSETPNRYIAFYPVQYMVTFGKEGSSWVEMPLNNTTGYEYESEPFMVPNGYKTDATYKYWVGITKHNGSMLYVEGKSSVDAMNTVSGLSVEDMAGKWGVWHIWSNSCANNWYGEFIHYYRVDFNLNGGEGDFAPRYGKATEPYVKFTTTDIGAPTRTGYTFLGWKDQNNKIYAPTDATVTINNDFTLTALWKENYASDNCRWEEVTIDDIEYGDEVVVTMGTNTTVYALHNTEMISKFPKAKDFSVIGNYLEDSDYSNYSWYIIKTNDGYQLQSCADNSKYLYGVPSYITISNTPTTFSIFKNTENGNECFIYIANSEVYYLGHGIKDSEPAWKNHTSTNHLTTNTLKFYKKVCLPEGQYRVTWDANGGQWSDGSTTKEEVYAEGATINKPEKPKRDGYEFTEWAPNPTTMPDENTTFTAQWAELHTINWMVGSSLVLTEDVANGTGVTQTPSDPVDGAIGSCANKFMGWSETALGSTEGQSAPAVLCTAAQMKTKHSSVNSDKTFHAVFATKGSGGIAQGTVLWAENFAHFGTNTPSTAGTGTGTTIYGDASITYFQSSTHTKGYNEEIAGGTKPELLLYKGGNHTWTIAGIPTGGAAKMTLSFLSNRTEFNVTSSTTGIIVSGSENTWNITANNDVTTFTLTIKNTNSDKNVRIDNVSVVVAEGGVSYSNYVTNCCNTPAPTNGNCTSVSGTEIKLTWDDAANTNRYHITGGNLSAEGVYVTNKYYNITGLTECEEYTFNVSAYPEDGCESEAITITAQPFSGAKTVTFNYNGNGQANTTTSTSCNNKSITLPTPAWTGYRFMGWFTAESGGTEIDDNPYTPTEDITLFAHWEKEYTVTYDLRGGTAIPVCSGDKYIAGEIVTICTSTPIKSGYKFTGWTYSPVVTITNGQFTMPASNVTITAEFVARAVTKIEVATNTHRVLMQGSAFIGEQIRVTYDNGETELLEWSNSKLTFAGHNTNELGVQTVTVTYTGEGTAHTQYNIEVIDGLGITFWDGNYTEVVKYEPGDLVDVDSRTGQNICSGWEFAGWSETKVANESNGFTPVHNFNAIDAKVLYAVYVKIRKNSSGDDEYESEDMINDLKEGARYVLAYYVNNNNVSYGYTALTPTSTGTYYLAGTHSNNSGFSCSETKNANNSYIYHSTAVIQENAHWQLIADGIGYWQLLNLSDKTYLDLSGHANNYAKVSNAPNGKIVIENAYDWVGDNNSQLYVKHSTATSDIRLSWDRSNSRFNQWDTNNGYILFLTKDEEFTSTPPCSPLSATFHGNGGIVTDGVNSGDNLTITEPTRDAGITTPTASFADCNGKSWTFVGWSREEIDVTRVPVLTTDLLHDGGGNKHYDIEEDGEEFWAVFTNTGNPETKYGTITFTDADVTREYENAKTITKSVTAMGDYDFELYRVSNASSKGIQFDHEVATRGYIKNITSLGKINSISLNDFQEGDIDDVKVYVGNMPNAINTLLTEADLQQTGDTYTYYPPKNYAYVKIEATGYCGITSISIDFGKGTEIWATTPNCSDIFLSGNELYVTSTNGQSIRAAERLTVNAVQLESKAKVVISSNSSDIYFSDVLDANFTQAVKPTETLTLTAGVDGNLAATEIYVHYRPSVDGTGIPEDVVVSANLETPNPSITDDHTIHVRNLPADFVIAAKVNDIWYALPNNCNSTSIVNGLPIDVDDPINPTSATFAPAEAKWGLKPVYTTSGVNDRYGDVGEYFVFAETNTGNAGLLYSNKDNAQVQTQGTYSGISGYTEITRYEWIPTTTDLSTYQLASAADSKLLSINVNGVFGTHSQLVAENKLRLLPIEAISKHAEVQVVEWRKDAVVFMYTGNPTHKVTTTLASTSTTKPLSEIKFDHGVYKMPLSNLLNNEGKSMSIRFYDGSTEVARTEIDVPVIVNSDMNTNSLSTMAKADYETCDVVILNGGKLTASETSDGSQYRFRNVTIYGGGKLIIGEGKYLSMASIILRAGGFANDGAYEYVYPQFELKGNLTNTAGKFYYDYITDNDHWYHLVLPFAGDLGTIKYPTEFYGSNVTTSNSGSWIIKRYAGDIRATGNYKAWVDIETDNPEPTSTTPGVGYIFWGAPKKVKVNGVENRQQWGIQRISMTKGAETAKTAENGDKTISGLSSYEDVANKSDAVNDQGWNLIGNPYMVNIATMSDAGLKAGKLEEEKVDGKWTGKWINNGDNLRYLTIPSEHFDTYEAKTVSEAISANALVPGRAFFVQLDGEANGITFAAANRASLMPALLAENSDKPVDIETGIILSNETLQDEVNFWIKAGKTNDYEYNADYPKTPNNNNFNIYGVHTNGDLSWVAISPEIAAESMPIGYQVPAAGTYMLSLSEIYNSDGLDALYVTDHALSPEVTVDIMSESYEFSVNQAETNNERFTVSVKVKEMTESGTTGVDNIGTGDEQIHKFIYQDKIYILHHGVIYDATGKRVITINK